MHPPILPLLVLSVAVTWFYKEKGGAVMDLGQLVMTRGIADAIDKNPVFEFEVHKSFIRYLFYDWGELCQEDMDLNLEALRNGDRILALYETSYGKIYIITEWDRSVTTILFAHEY